MTMRREFIKEVQGNLLDMFDREDSELHVIAHGANCFATMGAGIAAQIKKKYPEAYFADMYYQIPVGSIERLGNISGAHNNEIYNIYTQWRPGANADYSALRLGLRKLNALFAKDKNVQTLGLPLIGCGIGGLEWSKTKEIILEEITDMNLVIVHFTDEYLEKIPTTADEFNDKWRFHLETGFEDQGLAISDPEVCKYLDKQFKMFEKNPLTKNFTYSQIKMKLGEPRVYLGRIKIDWEGIIENKIKLILEETHE